MESLSDFLAVAPVMAMVTDGDGVIISTSTAFEQKLRLPSGGLIGRTLWDYVSADSRDTLIRSTVAQAAAGDPVRDVRLEFAGDDGAAQSFCVAVTAAKPSYDAGGAPHFLWVMEDVAELDRLTRKAEDALAARSRFLSAMSHELRTPMNAVLGLSHLLQRADLPPAQRRNVDAIVAAGERLHRTISSLLELAQTDHEPAKSTPSILRLRAFCAALEAHWKEEAESRSLEMRVTVDDMAPDTILLDRSGVRRVLDQLIANGLHNTQSGGVTVTVTQMAQTAGAAILEFAVSDTGDGIAKRVRDEALRAFTTSDAGVLKADGGIGLGLSLCNRIVRAMGGTFTIDRRAPGDGATVRVKLMADLVAEPPLTRGPALRILVADDNDTNRKVLRLMLERLGHEVDVATDGLEAVGALDRDRYDVVMMDILMPRLDGLGAAEQIRTRWGEQRRVPIVAVTGQATPDIYRRCIARGMDDCIIKPITMQALEQSLERLRVTIGA